MHQKPVQLRLWQRIGAFLFNRVLRRQHMKRVAQRAVLACNRHLPFLHRLQQRRLGARAGAVDLIRHQQLAEHRPFDEPERAAAVGGGIQHFGAEDIGGHQIGGELDAVAVQPHHGGQGIDQPCLAQPRQAHQQTMAATQQRRQGQVHHLFLADEAAVDAGAGCSQPFPQLLDPAHQVCRLHHDISPHRL